MLNKRMFKVFLFSFMIVVLTGGSSLLHADVYDHIVVKVRNHVITKNEIEIQALQEQQRMKYLKKEGSVNRKKILDKLIEDTLLDIRAEELFIQVSEDAIDNELDRFRKRNKMNEQTFEELLEHQQMTLADYRKMFEQRLKRNQVIGREIRSRIHISDEELKKEYDQLGSQSLQYRARHILRSVAPGASPEKEAKARDEIIWVKDQIEKSGAAFPTMADQYSQDPSVKYNHGDLGFFSPGDMVTEFSEMVSKLKKGVLSPPVRTQFGYHLIEVLDSRQAPKEPFDKVKEKLRRDLYQKRFQETFQKFMTELKKRVHIEYLDQSLAS